jgi:hypothetical protein
LVLLKVGNLNPIKPKIVKLQIVNSGYIAEKRGEGDGINAINAENPNNSHSKYKRNRKG